MTDPRPLGAYVVTLIFGEVIHTGTAFAASQSDATAIVSVNFMRTHAPTGDLTGMACVELPPHWLRAALQAIETGKPGAEVLSLVPKVVEAVATGDEPPRGPEVA